MDLPISINEHNTGNYALTENRAFWFLCKRRRDMKVAILTYMLIKETPRDS